VSDQTSSFTATRTLPPPLQAAGAWEAEEPTVSRWRRWRGGAGLRRPFRPGSPRRQARLPRRGAL